MNAKISPKWHKKERHHASRSVGWRRLVPMATGHRGSRQAAWPRQGGPGRSHRAPSTRPRHGGRTPAAPRTAWRRVPRPPWDAQGAPSRRGWSGGPRGDAPRKRAGQTQKRGDGAPRRLTLLLCRPSVRLHAGGCRGQRRWSRGRRVAGGAAGAREIMPAALFAKGKSSHGSEFAGSTASPRNDRGAPMRGVASGGGSRSAPDPSLDAELASRMSSVRRCLILKSDQEIPCCGHRLSLTMS